MREALDVGGASPPAAARGAEYGAEARGLHLLRRIEEEMAASLHSQMTMVGLG